MAERLTDAQLAEARGWVRDARRGGILMLDAAQTIDRMARLISEIDSLHDDVAALMREREGLRAENAHQAEMLESAHDLLSATTVALAKVEGEAATLRADLAGAVGGVREREDRMRVLLRRAQAMLPAAASPYDVAGGALALAAEIDAALRVTRDA